jgi:hypothetical protein
MVDQTKNEVALAVLDLKMTQMQESHEELKGKFDALNANYNSLINRGMGGFLVISTLGAASGYILAALKKVGL